MFPVAFVISTLRIKMSILINIFLIYPKKTKQKKTTYMYVVGTHWHCLCDEIPDSTHNIHFLGNRRKIKALTVLNVQLSLSIGWENGP